LRSVEQMRSLAEVSQAVNSTLDIEQVLETIVAHAVQLSAADGGSSLQADEVVSSSGSGRRLACLRTGGCVAVKTPSPW
jgi:hypothetical protein